MIVFELDDFHCDEPSMHALGELLSRNPKFKATCYTVVGSCDLSVLRDLLQVPNLELAVHGLDHNTERFWIHADADSFLRYCNDLGLSKLFKMPWYGDIPIGLLEALSDHNYKLATRHRWQLKEWRRIKTPVYLGCPGTVYAHPLTLHNKIDIPGLKECNEFYTVSEMFDHPQAVERGWVWRPQ